jgi:hypothetical protein
MADTDHPEHLHHATGLDPGCGPLGWVEREVPDTHREQRPPSRIAAHDLHRALVHDRSAQGLTPQPSRRLRPRRGTRHTITARVRYDDRILRIRIAVVTDSTERLRA